MKYFFMITLLALGGCMELPKIASASFSKNLCTCLFVLKRSEEQCIKYAHQLIKINSYKINKNKKSITAGFLFQTETAEFQGNQYGCTLKN